LPEQVGSADLRGVIGAAIAQLDSDVARLGRELRALPEDDEDGVSLNVYVAIATARRHALSWFGKVLAVDSPDPARRAALTTLSTVATALGSYYRALRAAGTTTGQREDRLAGERFAAAARAFGELDRELGCPYGCKRGG
jgi:hypothetical protein